MIHLSSDTGELFANSYQFAQRQVRKLIEKHPMLYPLHTKDGEWKHEGQVWTHWSDGFLPGMMWIFYRHAEPGSADAKFWFENAVRYTEPIEPRKKDRDAHDLGFPGEVKAARNGPVEIGEILFLWKRWIGEIRSGSRRGEYVKAA